MKCIVLYIQVFYHSTWMRWNSGVTILIQIGGGGFNGFSQTRFLSSYGSNWELEQKEKLKKKKLKKKVNFCNSSYINYCDTNSFFLTPLKKKTVIDKDKIDFKSICKVLWILSFKRKKNNINIIVILASFFPQSPWM